MKSKISGLFLQIYIIAAALLFIVALLFFSLQYQLTGTSLFEEEYVRLDHAKNMGMSTADLVAASGRMMDYMEGRAEDIDIDVLVNGEKVSMFNDRERAHMVDVRDLYQGFRTASYIFLGLFLIGIAGAVFEWRKRAAYRLSNAFLKSSAIFAAALIALGIWVLFDFQSFWTAFHHAFFNNDLWLLDPATSRMINMMPLQLFYAIVLKMAGQFLICWGILLAAAIAFALRGKKLRIMEEGRDTAS